MNERSCPSFPGPRLCEDPPPRDAGGGCDQLSLTGPWGRWAHSHGSEKTGELGLAYRGFIPGDPSQEQSYLSRACPKVPATPTIPASLLAVPLKSEQTECPYLDEEGHGFLVCKPRQSPAEHSHFVDEQSETWRRSACPRSAADG